jgi:Ca-activated chloride channel family protein
VSGNAKNNAAILLSLLLTAVVCHGSSTRQIVRQGNDLYAKTDWQGAIAAYEKATAQEPGAIVPKFNKANALFKSDDFTAAADAYRQVSAESREIKLVAKAKYNLGNCFFEEGTRQKDSDLQKSIDSLKKAISTWREVLDIDPANRKARENIENAGLILKMLMDEQKKRQEQQQQDPNSTKQQDKQQQGDQSQQKQQQQEKQGQDPNDPNQPGQQQQQKQEQKKDEKTEENKEEQKAGEEQGQKVEEKKAAPDATAEQILRDEQDRKKNLQPGGYVPVEQDW